MSHVLCPSCSELVPGSAVRCARCRELLRDFRECPDCLERVRAGARVCRHCGFRFARTAPPPVPPPPTVAPVPEPGQAPPGSSPAPGHVSSGSGGPALAVSATPVRALLAERSLTALVAPPELRLEGGTLIYSRWRYFGLRSEQEKFPVARVAAVRLLGEGLSAGIEIVARNGIPVLEIFGLDPAEAEGMVQAVSRAAGLQVRTSPPAPPAPVPAAEGVSRGR